MHKCFFLPWPSQLEDKKSIFKPQPQPSVLPMALISLPSAHGNVRWMDTAQMREGSRKS